MLPHLQNILRKYLDTFEDKSVSDSMNLDGWRKVFLEKIKHVDQIIVGQLY